MNASILSLVLVVLGAPSVETAKEPSTHLYVRTIPPGAKILLDDRPGTTDGLFSAVAPGKHRIVVELDGYAPERREVDVPQGRITRVEVSLKPTSDSYDGRSMAEWKRLAVTDGSIKTRVKAMETLAALGNAGRAEEAVAAIKLALSQEQNRYVTGAGYRALIRLGPPAIPLLLDGLKSKRVETRRTVVQELASPLKFRIPRIVIPEEVFSALLQTMHDRDPIVRGETCYALGRLGLSGDGRKYSDRIIPALIKALSDEAELEGNPFGNVESSVQCTACRALAGYGAKAEAAIPSLIELVKNKPAPLTKGQLDAVEALGRIGPAAKAVLPTLQSLHEPGSDLASDMRIRRAIFLIGGPNARGAQAPAQPAAKAEGAAAPIVAGQDEADKVEDLVEKALREKETDFVFEQAPLTDVVEHLARTTKLNVLLDENALNASAIDLSVTKITTSMRVSRGSAIDFTLSQLGLTWTARDGAMVITTAQKAQDELTTKLYPIDDLSLVGGSDTMIQIITNTIAPRTWDKAGGPGSITLSPRSDRLVIRQTYHVHRQIGRLLATLKAMGADAAAGKALEPILFFGALTASPAEVQSCRKALAEPVSDFYFEQSPLTDVADHVATAHKMNVVLDMKALEDAGIDLSTTKVTFSVRKIPLGQALSLLLERLGLVWTLEGDYVRITTKESAEDRLVVGVYPVGDLAPDRKPDRLIETITQTISPEKWESAGGPGSISPFTSDKLNVLVIAQTDAVHRQIAALLAQLRAKGQPPAGKPAAEKAGAGRY